MILGGGDVLMVSHQIFHLVDAKCVLCDFKFLLEALNTLINLVLSPSWCCRSIGQYSF